jgi:hypothetical protein
MNVMKYLLTKTSVLASLALLLFSAAASTCNAQDGRLQLTQLDHLASKASQSVDVNIDEKLIQLAAKFLGKEPDEVKLKEIIAGIKGVYVRSYEFEKEGEYSQADLESIRTQLRSPLWAKVVNVASKKEGNFEVYLMTDTSRLGGLAVVVSDPKELTIVNIIGPVDLEKLSQLEGQFGIPELNIETPKSKPRN